VSSLLNSVRWAAIAQGSKIVGQLASMAILSRLLKPTDYGVMAMAGVFTALATMLRDMGTGTAIVQRKELTQGLTSTVFWLNVALGSSIGLVLWAGSGTAATYFREPQLAGVLIALAGLFPVGGLTAVPQALIERRSGFKSLAQMDVTAQLVGLLVAIVAATNGAGVYSLVIPAWVSAIISLIWLVRLSSWRPSWIFERAEFRSLWSFSGNLAAFNFVNYFSRNADSMIVGRILGATPLGVYSMGYKLMLFPVQNLSWVVNRVMLPTLSRLQDDVAAARTIYLKMLGAIVTISAPLMIGLWVLRVPFVEFAFGTKWGGVATLLAWFAPIGFLQSMMSTVGTVFTAFGRTELLFRMGVLNTVLFLVSFVAGAQYSIEMVAAAYFVANLLNWLGWVVLTGRQLRAKPTALWAVLRAPILSGLAMLTTMYGALHAVHSVARNPGLQVLVVGFVGAACYLGVLTLGFGQSIRPLINVVRGRE